MNKNCLDCGVKLGDHRSLRCKSCARKGKFNPSYKNGNSIKLKGFCSVCGNEFKASLSGLCASCSISGDKHGNWQGGKPKCIDCGKQLVNYDSTRCHSCTNIERWKD